MLVFFLRSVAALVALLPPRWRERVGDLIAFLARSVFRYRRAHVEHAMGRAGVRNPAVSAREMYRGLGRSIVELLLVSRMNDAERGVYLDRAVARVFDEETTKVFEEAIADGPIVMLASHTGNWELIAAAGARFFQQRGRHVAIVAKSFSSRGFDAFTAKLRRALGIEIISPRGALKSVQDAIDHGAVIVMPIDQVPDRPTHGLAVPFLGAPVLVDKAPATIAYRAKATVLVIAGVREPHHRLKVLAHIPARREGDEPSKTWIRELTSRATAALEAFVLREPASWMWLHRRWRMPIPSSGPWKNPGVISSSSSP